MNGIRILHILILFLIIIYVKCEQKEHTKSKNHLPYFRRKVEEIEGADFFETTETEDHHNLVSFLVKNVREIFDDLIENSETAKETIASTKITTTESTTPTPLSTSTSTVLLRPVIGISTTEANISSSSISTSTHIYTNDVMLVQHLPLTTLLDKKHESTERYGTREGLLQLSKDFNFYAKTDKKEREVPGSVQPYHVGNATEADTETSDPRRSCIMCNNVASEDCNDPKNKL